MNLVRSFAAVVGTLGLALGAGMIFQQYGQNQTAGQGVGPDAADTASLAHGLNGGPAPLDAGMVVDDAAPAVASPLNAVPPLAAARMGSGLMPRPDGAPQTGPAAVRQPAGADETAATPQAVPPPAPSADPAPVMPATMAEADALLETILTEDPQAATPEPCALWLVVTPVESAMLDTSIYAPCHGGQQARLDHAGMRFDITLGDDGQAQLMVPALRADALVTLTMPDGRSTDDMTRVMDMAAHDRLVIGWSGPDAVTLHAFADGAGFGEAGHVHRDAPGLPGDAAHGFLTPLGDAQSGEDAARALVYTFPAGLPAGRAALTLSAEALITAASCGRSISARAMLTHGGEPGVARDISAHLPACDGIDGFLPLGTLAEPRPDGLAQAG